MWKISLTFIVVAASATFYITSSVYQNAGKEVKQRTFFDETNKLHVLGVILGKSTLRDAELAFRSRADSAIFLYPEPSTNTEEKKFSGTLEAYFPSIADHSKVMLELEIAVDKLEAMRQRSSKPRIYPNGVIRMNLSSTDILAVRKMIIHKLTLIPSIQLDENTILAQFGQPSHTSIIDSNNTAYTFVKTGLTATINKDGKDKLVFSNIK